MRMLSPLSIGMMATALASMLMAPNQSTTSAQVESEQRRSERDDELIRQDARALEELEIEQDVPVAPRLHFFLPDKPQMSTLYADGSPIKTEWESLWRPMCNSDDGALTAAALRDAIEKHNASFADPVHIEDDGIAGGFNIQFLLDGSVPAEAQAALTAVEAYLENKFNDSINIKINVSFDVLEVGVLGATGAYYTKTSWPNARAALKSDMDDSDKIQDYLPSGSTIPVRWNGNKNTVSQETRVFWTRANYKAAVGSASGVTGELIFNVNFVWDYNPSNGVVGYSFQDVLVHEVGHVLGFSSGADFRVKDIEALDIFRFQRTNGGHDYNPDTKPEFKVRPRLVSFNKPNDDHICDTITQECRMSDGNPYQCGHFREQATNIGLMDPSLSAGETHYPGFFSQADLRFFDAIGYDR